MSTINDPEDPAQRESAQSAEPDEAPERPDADETAQSADPAPDDAADTASDGADSAPAGEDADERTDTSIYVRRGRTPTLGFWVALAIAVPALVALISAPFFDFPDLGAVVNFVLLAAVMVGLPLAALAALIDAIRHRSPRSRRR